MPNRRDFLKVSAAGLAAAAGCGVPTARNRAAAGIVLVTLDTLRPDHLPFFGYPRDTAPFLTRLAQEGALFRNALCASSHTGPSHASILTGLHLPQHKFLFNGQSSMSGLLKTLPDYFGAAGYATAGFSAVSFLNVPARGFAHFQRYDGSMDLFLHYVQAEEQVDRAIAWLDSLGPKDPYCLWLHLFDPHEPYVAPEAHVSAMEIDAEDRGPLMEHWRTRQAKQVEGYPWHGDLDAFAASHQGYDAEIHYADAHLERLYRHLEKSGRAERTAWAITNDHGEGLGGHGYHSHGKFLYQDQVAALMLFHWPARIPPGLHDAAAHHVDLLPTLAELAMIPARQHAVPIAGRSLAPAFDGGIPPDRPLFAERRMRVPGDVSDPWEPDPVFCFIHKGRKYTHRTRGSDELFNLAADPNELTNLFAAADGPGEAMRAEAFAFRESLLAGAAGIEAPSVFDESLREDLEALGYFGAVTDAPSTPESE